MCVAEQEQRGAIDVPRHNPPRYSIPHSITTIASLDGIENKNGLGRSTDALTKQI